MSQKPTMVPVVSEIANERYFIHYKNIMSTIRWMFVSSFSIAEKFGGCLLIYIDARDYHVLS
jgi:hypothetical protein